MNAEDRSDAVIARPQLIRRAFALEYLTIAWMVVEAVVALVSGILAGSVTLVAFGADSIIEVFSALVLIWRLTVELRQGHGFAEAAETRARQIAGGLLFLLSAYVVASAGWSLWHRTGQEFSLPGLVVALVAIPAMYALARQKLNIAQRLGSRALKADAVEAITCGYLSFAVVIGLSAQVLFHAWWVDGVTSLAIVFLLVKEGREAWQGVECC
jgi:divalent metal cation (Fe/Co/Zn/Cd) transporter